MSLYYIIVLAVVQGITEFLPISSSAHLLLVHAGFNNGSLENAWSENLIMDLAVHIGTLFSVLVYFRKDVIKMIGGLAHFATGKRDSENSKLLTIVIVGSIPAILVGALVNIYEPAILRDLQVVCFTTVIFGFLLWWVDKKSPSNKTIENITVRDALFIGVAQTVALFPGTSRSGITMTAGRMIGLSRTQSAHYSLLLAMVVTSGAGALGVLRLIKAEDIALTGDALLSACFAFCAGLLTIIGMMKFLKTSSFAVFAAYRIALGIVLTYLIYTGVIVS